MVVAKAGKVGMKWQVFRVPMRRSGSKVWKASCPMLVLDHCQCKSYPSWREAMAHANGTADAA